jgi:hypothetical protein
VLVRPLLALTAAFVVGTTVERFWGAPVGGAPPRWDEAAFTSYTLLMGEMGAPLPADPWAQAVLYLLPLVGIVFVAEGVIKLGFTVFDKRAHPGEWVRIMAEKSRGHVVLCGLGTVGFRVLEELVAAGEQVFEARVGHGLEKRSEQKAVGEGGEALVFGERVRGAHAHAQGALEKGVTAAKGALVQEPEQRVENGRRAEKNLVEKGHVGLGEHARGLDLDGALAQLAEVYRAEDLAGETVGNHDVVGHGEAVHDERTPAGAVSGWVERWKGGTVGRWGGGAVRR